ncbi:hypothetical protein Emag_007899 [Eimeria magna]
MVDLLLGGMNDTWAAHRAHLRQLFEALRDANLQLHPGKCSFGAAAVRSLGHIVSRDGIKPCPSKAQAILEMPVPKMATAVQRSLGKCQYYRKFIRNFSITAEPLFQAAARQKGFTWTPVADTVWRALCEALSSGPVLAHPDYRRPFYPDCDGSGDGLGAVLLQPYDEGDRIVAYASRSLSDHERKWTATELEAAALIWALEMFRHYIDTIEVCIRTDLAPLEYMCHNSSQCRRVERWALRLQEFRFKGIHRPVNHVAHSAHRRMGLLRHRLRHMCAAVRAAGAPVRPTPSGSDDDTDVQVCLTDSDDDSPAPSTAQLPDNAPPKVVQGARNMPLPPVVEHLSLKDAQVQDPDCQ